jgi:hypothetical protein
MLAQFASYTAKFETSNGHLGTKHAGTVYADYTTLSYSYHT